METVWHLTTWAALLAVVVAIAGGYRRFELIAVLALLVLGAVGVAAPTALFSGFGHPALITIVSLYVSSQAITDSGMLEGLGRLLEGRLRGLRQQVLGLCVVTALLSAVMNNVGALALVLPTASRMSRRAGVPPGFFGMPLAWAAILGGTLTLAGSAPNIIVSSFRSAATGPAFRMFDFAPHGLAICLAGILLWLLVGFGQRSSVTGEDASSSSSKAPGADEDNVARFAPLATPRRRLCLAILLPAVTAVSFGWLSPALGFGLAAVLMVIAGVLDTDAAYRAVDLKVVIFLGSMLGLGRVLEDTGALNSVVTALEPLITGMGRPALLAVVFGASMLLSNVLNNAAAAVLMAPVAVSLALAGANAGLDALLMAVSAGACLALVLPTHQVTLMAMSRLPFEVRSFARSGLLLTLCAGFAAIMAIILVWR